MASFPTINKAPGVYIQEVTLPGPIAGVSTSIAAFVGPTASGPLRKPMMLTNIKQFWEIFGSYIETPYRVYAAHAVNGFFAEGGQQCYFVRVGNGVAAWKNLQDQANLVVAANPQQNTLLVTAQEEGVGGNSVTVEADAASIASNVTAVNPKAATPDVAANQVPVATPASTAADKRSITVTKASDALNFAPGDLVNISSGGTSENATIASVNGVVIAFGAALANSYNAGSIIKRDRITVTAAADAANFCPGDVVTITSGANTENATVSSISKATIVFQGPLTNTYMAGTIALANLTPGTLKIRVDDPTGLEPGSYVSISDGTNTEYNVVRLVNSVNNVITLTSGLTNLFAMGTGAPAVTIKSIEFTLKIVAKSPYPSVGSETFLNLAMDPRHSRYWGNIVNSSFVTVTLADPPSTTPPPLNLPAVLSPAVALGGGKDDNLATLTTSDYHAGIDALKKCTEVNLLCVPDSVTTSPSSNSHFQIADTHDIQSYMIAHCELKQDRFAILDPSQLAHFDFTYNAIQAQRQGISSDNGYGALYFPWIQITNPFGSGQIPVPPSGHIAGVYAKNDNIGVFKAPANEPILSALALDANLSDEEQGPLNSLGINVIRSFPNEGILIWGARTIAPPDITAWRFINVRRLLLFLEKSIQEGTRFAVFEPNNLALWQQIKRLVNDFLLTQWQEGALFGDTAAHAFQVKVDETNNPPEIRALGELIVQVTVVPTTPAEFIVFRVIQDITGASLQESTA